MDTNFGISFIGGGNMATAIIDSLLVSKTVSADNISVYDPSEVRRKELSARGVRTANSCEELAARNDILFLAVKPQVIDSVLQEIKNKIKSKCVVSIAAGISVNHIKAFIGEETPVIRVLPNTPMLILEGMTVVAEAPDVNKAIFNFVLSVFQSAGEVIVLPEDKINETLPLSSSSPAFFFRMLKAMAKEGVRAGISYDNAFKLAAVAMCGSAKYALAGEKTADELIRQVSSPGGTTIAALTAFDELNFDNLIAEAFKRCILRAYELGDN